MDIAAQVLRRFVARDVRVLVDRDATLKLRERFREPPDGEGSLIGTFDSDVSLYRIMDGEELRKIATTGKILGGMYSVKAERAHGASWGENITAIISWGNNQRGKRLGSDLFLAKIDARGKRFFHMNPNVNYDSNAPPTQTFTMDVSKCSTGLGCSVIDVSFDEATFYRVDVSGHMTPMSDADIRDYVKQRGPEKVVELRKISPVYYHGTIRGTDVYVVMEQSDNAYKGTWSVVTRDEQKLIIGAKTDQIAIDRASKLLQYGFPDHVTDLLPKSVMNEWRRKQRKYGSSAGPRDVEQWKSDLRRMTKIYRSIPAGVDDEKKTELMNEALPLFVAFHDHFESWVYDELLPTRDHDKQSWDENKVAKSAWNALVAISTGTLFPSTWRSSTDTHEFSIYELQRRIDTNITRYQRAFNIAFKDIEDLLQIRKERGTPQLEPVEQLYVGPLQVVVHNQGRDLRGEHMEEYLHEELSTLADAVRKMERAGFGEAARGLTVHVSFIQTKLTAGQYDPTKDELTMYPLGMGRENNQTFVHECGHRFYYRTLPSNARAHWKEVIDARAVTIEPKDIDHCVDTYVKPFMDHHKRTPTRHELRSLLHEDSVEMQAKCWEMADHIPGFTDDAEGVRKFWKDTDYINGARVNLEEITDYGSTNEKEAFAEAFMLYVTQGPRAVGPWTRQFFEMISRSGGAKLAQRVALRYASYFKVNDVILMGKYKNKRGRIVSFGQDKWGNPTVEVEPIPKGRKQNKVFGLYKIWRADVKENVLKKQQAEEAARAGKDPGSAVLAGDDHEFDDEADL